MADNKLVIGYYRISKEDGDYKLESNSITNQRLLIKNYVEEDTELSAMEYLELYDDGYSGTNMNRPGMQELLEKVKMEQVACILVKDFSRFARNYIELGTYLEQIFPFMGVRFISVTDNYDSREYKGTSTDVGVQFKGLLADFYSKEISRQMIAAKKSKRKNGKYCAGSTPFGYARNPNDKYELLIVEEEAVVIRRVFALTLERYSKKEICQLFNEEGIKTPSQYMANRQKCNEKAGKAKHLKWTSDMVRQILYNRNYIGDMLSGKTVINDIGSGLEKRVSKDEWEIYENHHEAIISREDFFAVQELVPKTIRSSQTVQDNYPLKGKVFCGNCKRHLARSKPWKGMFYFRCNYAKYQEQPECFIGHMDNDVLEQIVLRDLKDEIQSRVERYHMNEEAKQKHIVLIQSYQDEMEQNVTKMGQVKGQKKKALEDYHDGKLMREEFIGVRQKLDEEYCRIEVRVSELKAMIDEEERLLQYSNRSDEELLKYAGYGELTRELVEKFVKEIYVYKNGSVEIVWKFDEVKLSHLLYRDN